MNELVFPNDRQGVLSLPKDWRVACVSADPFHGGFCFGMEGGEIGFTDSDGAVPFLLKASLARQAINGLGWSGSYLVASSRAEVRLIGPWSPNDAGAESQVVNGGAFGVTVTTHGHFILPQGGDGWLWLASADPSNPVQVGATNSVHDRSPNFYAAAAFEGNDGNDLIAFALRRGGVGHTMLGKPSDQFSLSTATFDRLDIVDICSLATATHPRAAVAAARDGSLILFEDVGANGKPFTVKFKSISGTLYRVLSSRGDLFVLTSHALYLILAREHGLLEGARNGKLNVGILDVPVQGSDASLVDDKWLLVAGENAVYRLDVQKLRACNARERLMSNAGTNADWIETNIQRDEFAMSA